MHNHIKSLFSILLLLLCGLFTLGEKDKQAEPINTRCLFCHGKESVLAEKFRIDENNFAFSVHSQLRCTDCHLIDFWQDKEDLSHQKDLPSVNCTARCHQKSDALEPELNPLSYPDSVHGKSYLERGVQEVAKCWNCHTKHNIRKASDLASSVNRKNIPVMCSHCHEDMSVVVKFNIHCEKPYQEYMQSIHGKALFKDGPLNFAAVCTDCHGVHNIKGVGEPFLMAKKPDTCGKCHILVFNEYKESIHGQAALKGNIDVPLCVDCHGEHKIVSPVDTDAPTSKMNIPDTCSTCHSRQEIMKKYGIAEDRIESFIRSLHGIAVGFGYKAVANCTSCHGVHDIKPATDPSSKVNQANLVKTCGEEDCHPGMPKKIAQSKIHIDVSQKKSGAPYYVQQTLLWAVFILVLITIAWFVPGFIKKIKLLKIK